MLSDDQIHRSLQTETDQARLKDLMLALAAPTPQERFSARVRASRTLHRATAWSPYDPKPTLTRREELEGLGVLLFICGFFSILTILAITCSQ